MTSLYIPCYRDLEVAFTIPQISTSSKATVHYVEAGNSGNPKILLLHGFPSSSFQYRDFVPMLSNSYHVLAPDYPGFGLTKVPDDFVFTFENLTIVMASWLHALGIKEAAVFIQDFGAPVGLRLAITGALKPTAIISQNGCAHKEGLGPNAWEPLFKWWETGSEEIRKRIEQNMLTLEGTRNNIVKGTPEKDLHLIDPQAWHLPYLQNIASTLR